MTIKEFIRRMVERGRVMVNAEEVITAVPVQWREDMSFNCEFGEFLCRPDHMDGDTLWDLGLLGDAVALEIP